MAKEKLFTEFPEVTTQQWEEAIVKDLKGADYNKKLIWKTIEGFDVKPYYRADDLKGLEYLNTNPDEKPFVRGYHAKDNVWDIRQDIETDDLKSANDIAKYALNRGVNSLGFNAKKIESIEDLRILLEGIYVDCVKINFLKGRNFLNLLKLYVEYLKEKGVDPKKVRGSINFDPLHFALKHGKFWNSFEDNMNEATEILKYVKENLPNFYCLTVNGSGLGNSGSNITEELGFSLAAANEYMASLTDRGIAAEDVATRIILSFDTGSTYFMEIAKLRAARLLWTKIIEAYGIKDEKYAKIFIHATNTKYNKTVFDAYVNLLRTTTETMSAVIGGADSINVNPFDVAFKPSDEFSRHIATNQQILLKEESYLDKIVDPAAGSYYIENLTNNIAEKAWSYFKEVERLGGAEKSLYANYIQDTICATQELRAKDVARRKTVIVGTNQYPNITEKDVKIERQNCCCSNEKCNDSGENKQEFKPLKCKRAAEPFEKLRIDVINSTKKPKVYNILYGNLAMRNARQGFSTNFFGVVGYDIVSKPTDHIEQGIDKAIKANPDILVFCSSDDEYPEFVKTAIPLVKGKIKHLVVAGKMPEDIEKEFNAMGITDYINVRTNALESLTKYNNDLLK